MVDRIYDFKKVISSANSLIVLGPRGSGKSYYIGNLLNSEKFESMSINLLSRDEYSKYLSFPSALYEEVKSKISELAKGQLVVFIDEIQLVAELLYEIHRLIEELKGKVVFIVTGSSARKLKRNDVNLLAGRLFSFDFFPFSMQEVDCSTT